MAAKGVGGAAQGALTARGVGWAARRVAASWTYRKKAPAGVASSPKRLHRLSGFACENLFVALAAGAGLERRRRGPLLPPGVWGPRRAVVFRRGGVKRGKVFGKGSARARPGRPGLGIKGGA